MSLPRRLARDDARLVTTWSTLRARGVTRSRIAAQLRAQRWQRAGYAIVMHNGPLSERQRWVVARVHGGPCALLTAFTAASAYGLTGWERDTVHLLVPGGVTLRRGCPVPVRLHHVKTWSGVIAHPRAARVHALPDALLRAAATFGSARPGCGLLAAAVQQRLADPPRFLDALERSPRLRHRAALLAAVRDIGQGAEALSEIDFVRLCHRFRLPRPQQTVRHDAFGRRRYLDATWRRADGRLVVVEVDGALHLSPRRWYADQLRQNEISLAGALVLRFPSVVVRCEPQLVAAQLRRALGLAVPVVD